MWLIVLAPLVSQLVVAAREDDPSAAVVCSAAEHTGYVEQAAHDDAVAACGYCDLLAAHAAISAVRGSGKAMRPARRSALTWARRAAAASTT